MSIAKRSGWILIGTIVGALATSSVSAVKKQVRRPVEDRH